MFKFTNLNSVDSILSSFHQHVTNLEHLIEDRVVKVDNALIAEAKAIETRLMHSKEIEKAKVALTKIKDFIS